MKDIGGPCLVLFTGQEGAGKSTIVRALLSETPNGAVLDAEDVGQVNPWVNDDSFRELHRRNVAALIRNFWDAGYRNVVAGSFLRTAAEYEAFRPMLPADVDITVVQLLATRAVRDRRRLTRTKRTSAECRDAVDRADPEDTTLRRAQGDFRYVSVDTSELSVAETVARIKDAVPAVWG